MTRINCIPVTELVNQHLLAEYRELPRVFTLASDAIDNNRSVDIPNKYTMGKGHVLFFYNKLMFLYIRWIQIRQELIARGYTLDMSIYDSILDTVRGLESHPWWNNWIPTQEDMDVNRERIALRLIDMEKRRENK